MAKLLLKSLNAVDDNSYKIVSIGVVFASKQWLLGKSR